MSGITSGVGLFSGIDRRSIIDQLISIDARPRQAFQARISQIQGLQAALLDVNSRLSSLRANAGAFNLQRVFEAATATSSNADVLSASAAAGATAGSYSFLVDRLVSTQQVLSRGFADNATTAVGASAFTFEPAAARLDSQTRLSSLNGGTGIVRGRVVVTDAQGTQTQVDLSRVETVSEVVRAFNDALGARASLSVDGDRLVLTDTNTAGAGTLTITDAPGTSGTVASLGLNVAATAPGYGEAIAGSVINRIGAGTTLRSLNDGLGVGINTIAGTAATPDFTITTRDGSAIEVDIGDVYDSSGTRTATAVSDLAGVIARINDQAAGKVTASIDAAGTGLRLVDNTTGATAFKVEEYTSAGRTGTTAADLGILATASGGAGQINGTRLIAAINSTLVKTLRGGLGVGSGLINATTRNGDQFSFNISPSASVSDTINQVRTLSGNRLSLEIASNGRGFILRDLTVGSGPLSIDGEGATALGLFADEASTSVINGFSAQRKYIGTSTLLSTLNAGRGIGTGQFAITDSLGISRTINISASATTVGDVISAINSSQGSPRVRARINDNGDGILLEEVVPSGEDPGTRLISVRDSSGAVARLLGLAREAGGTGSLNRIDGTFERTVTFAGTDTLQQVADKINQAGGPAIATIIADGSSAAPYRLSLAARNSGEAGQFVLETNGLDLGLTTLAEGANARIFYGSSDPARGVLLSSTTNSFGGLAGGLTVEARSASASPVTVSVSTGTETIEKAVDDFIKSYNDVVSRIQALSRFDTTTQRRGALLGESTTQILRGELATTVLSPAIGASGRFQTLIDVGFSFDRGGNLTVDKARLRSAIAEDPRGVRDLIAGRAQGTSTTSQTVTGPDGNPLEGVSVAVNVAGNFTQLGVAEKLANLVDKYIKPIDGVLTRRGTTLEAQIASQTTRIAALDKRLESRRASLERQFVAMESTIGRLQSQQGAIGSIQSILR
ncbi:MAG: flagellar filament capping protein FliD [Phycisphaerales bacterium]